VYLVGGGGSGNEAENFDTELKTEDEACFGHTVSVVIAILVKQSALSAGWNQRSVRWEKRGRVRTEMERQSGKWTGGRGRMGNLLK